MNTHHGTVADDAIISLGYGDNDTMTVDSLADLHTLAKRIDRAIEFQVEVLRNGGESWEKIGTALGVTRQAAQKRFRLVETFRNTNLAHHRAK